jgi:hypothetical protein
LNTTLQVFAFDIIAATLMRSFLCWSYDCFAAYNRDESALRNFITCQFHLFGFLFGREIFMDTFENASPPHEQPEKVLAKCWECGEVKMCFEHIVCCTGTRFHTCPACRVLINQKVS